MKKRILVVDDTEIVLAVTREALEKRVSKLLAP